MAQQKKSSTSTTSTRKKTTSSSSTKKRTPPKKSGSSRVGFAVLLILLGIFSLLGCFPNDGVIIKLLRTFMSGMFGTAFYLLPLALIVGGAFLISKKKGSALRATTTLLLPILLAAFMQLFTKTSYSLSVYMVGLLWEDGIALKGGGVLGGSLTLFLEYLLSKVGAILVLVLLSALDVITLLGMTVTSVVESLREKVEREREYEYETEEPAPAKPAPAKRASKHNIDIPVDDTDTSSVTKEPENKVHKKTLFNSKSNVPSPDEFYVSEKPAPAPKPEPAPKPTPAPAPAPEPEPEPDFEFEPEPAPEPVPPRRAAGKKQPREPKPEPVDDIQELIRSNSRDMTEVMQEYKFPPISFLDAPGDNDARSDNRDELMATKERLEMTLESFGINAEISNIVNGPSVTRYEMELEIGVKLNKLTNLADDIALSLGVGGVRIAAIPNKILTVGIEVPNKHVSTVYLREIITSKEFTKAKSKLTFAMGKDISGGVIVGNIAKLPHLLVAGTTGSGKSVCLNSMILSLMYKATPEEVRFIMIDPKMVEFKIYNGIPHLLIPVVTEAKKAAGALQWAVTEMMKRYSLFSDTGVRDLASYNEATLGTDTPKLPQIVVIIDELADLMMVAAKDVEESICRVAQMGRAAGVHLVIATQSPRADVITGLMKANIPSRISFKVASALESRIILDAGGNAEKLVGNGDMLFSPIGETKPLRLQGAWVSDEEREKVVEYVKSQYTASYSEDVINQIEKTTAEKDKGSASAVEENKREYDELIPQAADVIFETNQASVSMLQRRLKLGYARAARIVDQLEEMGVVGPFEGSKPRQIIMTKEQWLEKKLIYDNGPLEQTPSIETEDM